MKNKKYFGDFYFPIEQTTFAASAAHFLADVKPLQEEHPCNRVNKESQGREGLLKHASIWSDSAQLPWKAWALIDHVKRQQRIFVNSSTWIVGPSTLSGSVINVVYNIQCMTISQLLHLNSTLCWCELAVAPLCLLIDECITKANTA